MSNIDEHILIFFHKTIHCDFLTDFFYIFVPHEFWIVVLLVFSLLNLFREGVLKIPVIAFALAWQGGDFFSALLKNIFNRPRPFVVEPWVTPLTFAAGPSLPSGHATISMAMAVVLGHHYPRFRVIFYLLAVLSGLSRVYLGVHYMSDVLAGFVLGGVVGWSSLILEKFILSITQGVKMAVKRKAGRG